MAIRNQPQSGTFPYASPTTPGLYVTFRAYIIELLCLNVNNKLGPRFWSDKKKWGPKFGREVKGVDNVIKQIGSEDILLQTAFVQIVREHNIKSLMYKTTVKRVVKNVLKRKAQLEQQRKNFQSKPIPQTIDVKKNSTFVDTGKNGVLAKIRKTEDGQEESKD